MDQTRKYWLDTMLKISTPVLVALSEDRLKSDMPIEMNKPKEVFTQWVYLEALGRVIVGIAPWLACEELDGEEENLRTCYAELTRKCISVAVNPASKDYMDFTPSPSAQPIVDAAFLAEGILRAPHVLWEPLDEQTKKRLIAEMKKTRSQKPYKNNWLLFSAMIEAFLYFAGEDFDKMRIDYALDKHMEWYKGDGWYGDGASFHTDYYNSFVIHPMLMDILAVIGDLYPEWSSMKDEVCRRARRYATVQERLISPEGTYPLIGRSLTYRFGAFHTLAQIAYKHLLEPELSPAQVRCALSAVIKKVCSFSDMFDENGWLKIGVCGYQPSMAESYISTASQYLCTAVFLPLGLPENDEFWSSENADWTSKKLWAGEDMKCDHAVK